MAGGYEIGLSSSEAQNQEFATQFRPGDVHVDLGESKQTMTLYIVAGVVAVAAVLLMLLLRGGRR